MKLARNGNAPRPAPQGYLNFEVRKGRLLVPATLSHSDKRPFVPAGEILLIEAVLAIVVKTRIFLGSTLLQFTNILHNLEG